MASTPVIFFVLAIAAARQRKQPVKYNYSGATVMAATRIAPTIVPILFAAIAGRTLKTIAGFVAEKEATVGTLEVLMGSQTLWSTRGSQLAIRKFTIVGAHVLLLWYLSPTTTPSAYAAGDDLAQNPSRYGPATNPASLDTSSLSVDDLVATGNAPFAAANATAATSDTTRVYICDFFCLTPSSSWPPPDVLGYAASSSGVQDEMLRARALRDVRVIMGDVWAEKKVGHVALATVEGSGVGALREGRLYV
ncbi:hypothetical protein B0A49_11155 [Cryomyces minteri]|uniref:Uncharacterized protein n=1 Tax=Cryomyces minteri TaxID=331657 RepID=A0A4U0WPZ3_9PEZI|nr:hypothetical protein B0A49_11155 [Cryomyces minteri]